MKTETYTRGKKSKVVVQERGKGSALALSASSTSLASIASVSSFFHGVLQPRAPSARCGCRSRLRRKFRVALRSCSECASKLCQAGDGPSIRERPRYARYARLQSCSIIVLLQVLFLFLPLFYTAADSSSSPTSDRQRNMTQKNPNTRSAPCTTT